MTKRPNPQTNAVETNAFPLGHVTRSQLVRLSGKGDKFWSRLERAGKGPPITRLGKTPIYELEALRSWLKSQELEEKSGPREAMTARRQMAAWPAAKDF